MLHSQVELEHLLVHVHANLDGVQGTIFTCADEGWNTALYSFVMQLAQEKHSTNMDSTVILYKYDRRRIDGFQKEVLLRLFVHNVTVFWVRNFETDGLPYDLGNRPAQEQAKVSCRKRKRIRGSVFSSHVRRPSLRP